MNAMVSIEKVASRILCVRGKKVLLDRDLAELYQVKTKTLNQAVRRNMERFPDDFIFKVTEVERLEVVTACDHLASLKFSSQLPYAFTEQGVAMLSSVLNSERAIMVNIQIMRAFTQLRRMLMTNRDLRQKIEAMEKKYDEQFAIVFEAIKRLLEPPKQTRAISFYAD